MQQMMLADLPVSYGRDIILREANGVEIRQRADNYFDATAMCRAYGKAYAEYGRLKDTAEFLGELSSNMRIPMFELVQVRNGHGGGTWVHRRVAIDVARWCSAKFAVIVNGWVDDLLQGLPVNLAEARSIDPFVLDKLLVQHREEIKTVITEKFSEQRRQIAAVVEINTKRYVPKPRAEFTPAVKRQIVEEWLRQNPHGLDPTGKVRIAEHDENGAPRLIDGVGELHHMRSNWRTGFRDGLPVWVDFHDKLTLDTEQVGDEWRRAKNAHKHFLDKADAGELTLFDLAPPWQTGP